VSTNRGVRQAAAPHRAFRRELVGLLWISPWIIGFLAFMLLPIAMSLYYSFTDYNLLEAPLWIGARNWWRKQSGAAPIHRIGSAGRRTGREGPHGDRWRRVLRGSGGRPDHDV